ncbi:hypothetical protein, partial [Bacteroides thetaiotaomicron]|uniref:hypothetical protein n=1 Tax=Bacteroides thetaiotaomicron TaxID=818 RepID=UPI00189A68C8
NIPCYVQVNIKIRRGRIGGMPFKLRAAPPVANPAVRVQSYALNAVSDRGLTRTINANRRNVLPLAGEVIRIQKYPCLFAA